MINMTKKTKKARRTITLKYTFRNDILFKILFLKHPELLKHLVACILNIPMSELKDFRIINSEMPADILGSKFCRLDIAVVVNGVQINLEIQNWDESNFIERTHFNWGRLYTMPLNSGDDYALLKRTIVISFVNFKLFKRERFDSRYLALEAVDHEPLSNDFEIRYFELPKVPEIAEIAPNNDLQLWLYRS